MIAAKHSMMGGAYTPIDGILSDGVAYAALPNPVNASSGAYEVEFTIIPPKDNYVSAHLLGTHGSSNGAYFLFHSISLNRNGAYCFGMFSSESIGLVFSENKRTKLVVSRRTESQYVELDGADIGVDQWSPVMNRTPFLIFRANSNSSEVDPALPFSFDYIVIHKLKVWFGDTLVADLIPCKIKGGEVCFVNLLDKSFIHNIAGGSSRFLEAKE